MRTRFALSVAVVLAALLAIPTIATAMPPNEQAIIKSLTARGIIPRKATPAMQQLAYKLYIAKKMSGGSAAERGNPLAEGAVQEGLEEGDGDQLHGTSAASLIPDDNILVLLVEFDGTDDGKTGPLHNEIAQPDPATDNTSYWVSDFSPAHYNTMLFGQSFGVKSFTNYFREQSGGTYLPSGNVSAQWVKVPHSESYYGADDADTDDANGPVWRVVQDAVAAAGDSIDWAQYDVEDPYDLDGDSDIDEPDGYVDHLMVIHAGAGQEAGGGAQGDDAIWSHSWWVDFGAGGPGYGGVQTADPNVWVGPYTIEPEDGTVGVFVHEYAHDLGLPDQYDTIYSGESSTGFWTLMSSGSWLGDRGQPLGTSPSALSAWEKEALGWLDPAIVQAGDPAANLTLKDAAASGTTGKGIKVELPDYAYSVYVTDPVEGSRFWYSGAADNLDNTMARQVALPAGTPALTFKTWYDIEEGYDYGYVEVSEAADPGVGDWTVIPGNLTDKEGGITGASSGWQDATYDLSAYAGKTVWLRLRYLTDGGVSYSGWAVDQIAVGSVSDDAEYTGTDGWTVDGAAGNTWHTTTGIDQKTASHFYYAEWRQPTGFDTSMRSWYNFPGASNVAEFFKAAPGMLVWYGNSRFAENWVGVHPWAGQLLLVDSHPTLATQTVPKSWGFPTKKVPLRTRIQLFNAAFSKKGASPITVNRWGGKVTAPGGAPVPTFDDSRSWFDTTFASYLYDYDTGAVYRNAIDSVATPTYGVKLKVMTDTTSAGTIKVDYSDPIEDLPR